MTTQEMHIEIDLELQRINSQVTKNLLPQEKDWFLNNEVIKFFKQRKDALSNLRQTGFQDTSKRVEDVKDLVKVVNRPIEINNEGEEFITLPSDYFDYVRFDAYLKKDCETNVVIPTVNTLYKTGIEIPNITDALTVFTVEVHTVENGIVTLFNMAMIPDTYLTNEQFKKQRFLLIQALKIILPKKVKELLSPSSEIYWERIGYDFNELTFTLVTDIEHTIVKTIINATEVDTTPVSNTNSTYSHSDLHFKSQMRVIDEEFLTHVVNSHLSKSRMTSPIGTLREGVLLPIKPKGAILGNVKVVYICKPNIIDLLLDSNLNVSTKVAKEITGNTVRFMKAIIGDGNYQAYARENTLIE